MESTRSECRGYIPNETLCAAASGSAKSQSPRFCIIFDGPTTVGSGVRKQDKFISRLMYSTVELHNSYCFSLWASLIRSQTFSPFAPAEKLDTFTVNSARKVLSLMGARSSCTMLAVKAPGSILCGTPRLARSTDLAVLLGPLTRLQRCPGLSQSSRRTTTIVPSRSQFQCRRQISPPRRHLHLLSKLSLV
jgi:hypothetical protein